MALSMLILNASCTHLAHQEQAQWNELKSLGIRDNSIVVANPALAGGLNILPGIGNFYLASGNGGESMHWLYGAINLVTWPISILWGIPEAIIDSNTINKRELIYYYYFDQKGKEELKNLKKEFSNKKSL